MAESKRAKQKVSQSPFIFFFFNLTATTEHHRLTFLFLSKSYTVYRSSSFCYIFFSTIFLCSSSTLFEKVFKNCILVFKIIKLKNVFGSSF
jgi:hypothetical protein